MTTKKTSTDEQIESDPAARATIEDAAARPPEDLTTGGLQTSFHQHERQHTRADYTGAFPIVAVGASAGGIESFTELLSNLPATTGMAFVLIQHLAPLHESLLPSILSRATPMEVLKAEVDMRVDPNKVYVIPPNTNMGIVNGVLKLLPRLEKPGRHMPIDFFMRCLADDQYHLAIGVILSGGDGDGTQGLRSINGQGGLTIVQDPMTAKVDSMPRHAIASGVTDTVLTIRQIAEELVRVSSHPMSQELRPVLPAGDDLKRILRLLSLHTGVDFTAYKKGTVLRRLRRRLLLRNVGTLREYLDVLKADPEEIENLYRDLLINVTNFFRDETTFEVLKQTILPKVLKRLSKQTSCRIWVPACATGEEAYSYAIIILEAMEAAGINRPLQLFASDLSETALDVARTGIYSDTITTDVSPERLNRFFTAVPGGYRVKSALREACVFAKHDVTRDPPFSRMDLISCRNLLIYLEPPQQRKVLNQLTYGLHPGGYLVLGSAENVTSHDSFDVVDRENRIFQRKATLPRLHVETALTDVRNARSFRADGKIADTSADLSAKITKVLLDRFVPSAVIVTAEMDILHIYGSAGNFLEPAAGEATLNLFKMARPGLDTELRILIKKAQKSGKNVRKDEVRPRGFDHEFSIDVQAVTIDEGTHYFVIVFGESVKAPAAAVPADKPTKQGSAVLRRQISLLEEELATTREYLQSIVHDKEVTNEELQAANEEILSSNEELQSTNEELETAKEELQSINEELTTVNDELSVRNTLLVTSNSDLGNLLASVDLPIIMIGEDLCIRRFTPQSERVFKVIASDVGRPITDIKSNLDVPDFESLLRETLKHARTIEREVQDLSGQTYSLRIRPYKITDRHVEGAVIVLVNLGDGAESGDVPRDVRGIDVIQQPVIFLDSALRVNRFNTAARTCLQVEDQEFLGKGFFEVADGAWNLPVLKALLSEVVTKNTYVANFLTEYVYPHVGHKRFLLSARRVRVQNAYSVMVMLEEMKGGEGT